MYAIALSLKNASFSTREDYSAMLQNRIRELLPAQHPEGLVVLPGYLDFFLAQGCGFLGESRGFEASFGALAGLGDSFTREFLELHREVARACSVHVVPGSFLLHEGSKKFLATCLLSPTGEVLGLQKQAFLSRKERALGLCRADTLEVFSTELGSMGLLPGTDCFYPETGRVLGLKGANIVCHPGALRDGHNPWRQRAGMWQQVQQNQFFCVESQLKATLGGEDFTGTCLIHAPCEMTSGQSGILASEVAGGAAALLDTEKRLGVLEKYSLLNLLNPAAYTSIQENRGVKT